MADQRKRLLRDEHASGLDRTAIFLKLGGSGLDRTEKIFFVLK